MMHGVLGGADVYDGAVAALGAGMPPVILPRGAEWCPFVWGRE